MAFTELTKRQLGVFEQIATNNDSGHPQKTLDSLERRGYISSEMEQLSGFPPVQIRRYYVPIPVHIEWCQWCAKQQAKKDEGKMKTRTETVIEIDEWDDLVSQTYRRPYRFQQQDGCKDRGTFRLTVPDEPNDFQRDEVPEEVNDPLMGVSFAAWLARDPAKPLGGNESQSWEIALWWDRNFYPDVQMVANDLHAKGLLPAGDYAIDIDW